MDARLLVDSRWMVSEAFGLGEVPREPLVTIAGVSLEVQEGDKGKEKWGVLSFVEPWAKPLKVNRTHQKALILMFGAETDAWRGKRISLYAMSGVFFGKRSTAVRIKGSPDIKEAKSFQVKKFGGGRDTYSLVPIGAAPAAAPPPAPAPVPPAAPAPAATAATSSPPPAPAPPSNSGEPTELEKMLARIAEATETTHLEALVPAIKQLPKADQLQLKKAYADRRDQLAGGAAGAA